MAGIPPFNPEVPIPNNPFFSLNADRYNLAYPTGVLIFGDYLFVDYSTGNVYISPNPPNNGTVRQITAGPGLETTPPGGITTTGSVALQNIASLTPGSVTYPTISVNGYGQLTLAVSGNTPLTTLSGTEPIYVTGVNPSLTLAIRQASTTTSGAVQIVDSLSSSSTISALSAQQGYNLGLQFSFLGLTLAGQVFAGMIDPATGDIAQLTTGGSALPGLAVGSPVPAGAPVYDGAFFVINADGTYTPPGGVATSVVVNDRLVCIESNWVLLLCGTRLANASSGTAGLTVLATPAEIQARTEQNKVVTAGDLAIMQASETQDGFVELATDAETQAFTDNTRAVTASNLNNLNATTTTRGLVRLVDSTSDPSTTSAPTSAALTTYVNSGLQNASVTAKGDLLVGLSYQSNVILPKGPQESYLTVDTTKPAQGSLDWNVPDSLSTWPVGAIIWYAAVSPPTSLWLACDGAIYDGALGGPYFALYDLIGNTFNQGGEPAGFFRVPDLRGVFIRGWSGAGPNPNPTALDPGRAFASLQADAYLQHNHTVTDPSHLHQFPLLTHNHPSNAPTKTHVHPSNGGSHRHNINGIPNAEVVGDTGGFYDGNAQWGAPQGPDSTSSTTGVSLRSALTSMSVNSANTGLTVDTVTTGLTVDNSPPVAPNPDETRPYNLAMLPMIKFRIA